MAVRFRICRWLVTTNLLAIVVWTAAGFDSHAAPTASEQFATLLDDAWQFELRENPLFATETGDHRYDDQLPKVSLADAERRNETKRAFLARLRCNRPRRALGRGTDQLRHLRPAATRGDPRL